MAGRLVRIGGVLLLVCGLVAVGYLSGQRGPKALQDEAVEQAQVELRAESNLPGGVDSQTFSNELAAKAVGLKRGGDIHAALALLDTAMIAHQQEFRPEELAFLVVISAEYLRRTGQWENALDRLDWIVGQLDDANEDHKVRLCNVYGTEALIYYNWGLMDDMAEATSRMKSVLASMEEPATYYPRELRKSYLVQTYLHFGRNDYSRLQEVVASAFDETALYAHKQKDLQQLDYYRRLGRLHHARRNPEEYEPAIAALGELAYDDEAKDWIRTTPSVQLALAAIESGEFHEASKLLAAAKSFRGQALSDDVREALSWQVAVRMRLALASGKELSQLQALHAELSNELDLLLESFMKRDLRPGGYGYFNYDRPVLVMSELMRSTFAIGRGLGEPDSVSACKALEMLFRAQDCGMLPRLMIESRLKKLAGLDTDEARERSQELRNFHSTVSQVQSDLIRGNERSAVLVYFPAEYEGHLFLIEAHEVNYFPLESIDEIMNERKELSRFLGPPDPRADAWKVERRSKGQSEACERLSDLLFPKGPLRERLARIEALTIIHGGFFGDLPFEALSVHGVATLGASKSVATSPSVSVSLLLAMRGLTPVPLKTPDMQSFSLVAAPKTAPGALSGRNDLRELPVGEGLLGPIANLFGEDHSGVRLRSEATIAALKECSARSVVTQLFAHGGTRNDVRRAPVVALAPCEDYIDGVFAEEQLRDWKTSRLMIMMVCRSGQASMRRGDAGATGFAGAFFRCGTNCVIESSFDIDYEIAERLSVHLYTELADGSTPAEALRTFRAELIEEGRFADPFYHSLIRVVGAGHEPVFAPR